MQWPAGGVPRWSRDAADGGQLAPCAPLPSLEVSLKCQRCPPSPPRHYHNSPEVFAIAFQSAVPRRRVGWVPPVLLPGLPTLHLLGCEGLPGILGVLKPPLLDVCRVSSPPAAAGLLVDARAHPAPQDLPLAWPGEGMAARGGNGDGLGTAAGGRDAGSESRAAAELVSTRLPPSPRHPPPGQPLWVGWGPQHPRPSPLTLHRRQLLPGSAPGLGEAACAALPFASPLRGDASASRLSPSLAGWLPHTGTRQPPAAPEPTAAPSLLPPAAPMSPAQGLGNRGTWKRTARPFAHRRHPPARTGLLSPWHVPSPRSVAAGGTGLAVPSAAMAGAGSQS